MPSVHDYNQTDPFWEFIANLQQQGASRGAEPSDNENEHERSNGWQDWVSFPLGPMPHHGRHPRGPPPPPPPPPPHHHHHHHGHPFPPSPPAPPAEGEAGPSNPKDDPSQPFSDSEGEGHAHHGRHNHAHHGPGARGGRCGGGRGRGRGGPRGFCGRGGRRGTHYGSFGPFGPFGGPLGEIFQEQQLFGNNDIKKKENKAAKSGDFTPEVDVFDTPDAFVIHTSLPGAKKEDVAVNWNAERSELSIAGVMYRPGDEEFLKTLTLDERKVGAFDRKVRLGSRANPVDVDAITARLEDGVLRVEVPKLDAGYVEIKKVDIE